MVRAKFRLIEVRQHHWSANARTLVFQPEYDASIEEDRRFATATPSGRFEMHCDNPAANAQFELGQPYYFDITPAAAQG